MSWTYIHNEEVQPTPGIGKVLDKTIGDPFQQHLQDEDVGENPVGILQNDPNGLPLFDVHILKRLWINKKKLMSATTQTEKEILHMLIYDSAN